MAGRALAFSDPEIVRMGREDFVAVAADDWYQRRRQDAEGKFFISVANQGPRKGEGGVTRQGIYVFTAAGKLLAYRNAGQSPEVMRDVLRQGLRAWRNLPVSERAPGAVVVPEQGAVDPAFHRELPAGGLRLRVFTRTLEADASAEAGYRDAAGRTGNGDEAGRDHLWFTAAEWRSLIPAGAKAGDQQSLPPALAERVLRFHLVDNTRGEPPFWRREEIRRSDLRLVVVTANGTEVLLRLEGAASLATPEDAKQGVRGFEAALLGWIRFDRKRGEIDRFDLVAVGEHWGEGPHTRRARSGRSPLGVAFSLARGDSEAERIAPQGARDWSDYFGRSR